MSKTDQYEYLLDRKHVVALEWDDENEQVVVFVTEKLPEDLLNDEDIISNNLGDDEDSDVIEGGEPWLETARDKHRPILAGLSEGPVSSQMAGTGGPLAKVRDPNIGEIWSDEVEKGDYVRISNNHVYCGVETEPGIYEEKISQPAALDGGSMADAVGDLVGYVPLRDRGLVDCAARATHEDDTADVHQIEGAPSGIRRDYSGLRGTDQTKSGRTTEVKSGEVRATSATVRVRVSKDKTLTFRDQIITDSMSSPGDSGSESVDEDGQLSALLFAGSDKITILNKISNVEAELGVEMVTEIGEDPSEPSEPTPNDPKNVPYTITIGPGSNLGSVEYMMEVEDGASVDFSGHSASVVDNHIIGWCMIGWNKEFTITGKVVDAAIPEGSTVLLNGEPIHPSEVVDRSQELVEG